MFLKFAKADIIDVKHTRRKVVNPSLAKFAKFEDYQTDDGYLYVRVRAISSRVNKNNDGWPSEELKKSYSTFLGKPIFVDHHNSDPKKARGVVVDAALHIEDDIEKTASLDPYYASAPANHLPPTWVELLLEVDAKAFPKLAKAIIEDDIDGVSMGANVERSVCSHCSNEATTPEQYCKHVQSKGAYFDYYEPNGTKTSKRAYEDCYDIGFFELSFVFDPADETALKIDHKAAARKQKVAKAVNSEFGGGLQEPEDEWGVNPPMDYCPHGYPNGEGCAECGGFEEGPSEAEQWRNEEPQRILQWKIEELVNAGYSPEEAAQLAEMMTEETEPGQGSYPIYRDLINLIDRGATPDQARRIITRRVQANQPCPNCGAPSRFNVGGTCAQCGKKVDDFQVNQPQPGGILPPQARVKTADEENSPPQSEMTTMPETIDTLRQDQICPICGSDMEDGQCEVCNYQEPPEGFNNPDLEKAKEVDQQLHDELEQQAVEEEPNATNQVPLEGGQGPQGGTAPGDQGMPMPMASVSTTTANVSASTSNVTYTTVVSSEQKVSAAPSKGVRINTQERPILPATRKLTDKAKNQKTIKDSKKPVESNHKEKENMTETTQKIADGASPQGEGVQAEKRVDVDGVGAVSGDPLSGIENENVEKDTGDFVAPHTDTWSGEEGDSLTSADAVGSDAGEDLQTVSSQKTAEGADTWDSVGGGFPDHDPTRVDLEQGLAEEVGEATSTDSSGTAFRSLEQANPVDTGDNGNQVGGPIGEAIAKAKAQVVKAMKVAETEVALGLIENDSKFERVAELEDASEEVLDAQLETLAKVKTAGLRKAVAPAQSRTAGRMPSFKPVTASFDVEAHAVSDQEIEDALW